MNNLSFKDFLDGHFLNYVSLNISYRQVLLTLSAALFIGIFVCFLYWKTYTGKEYNARFNLTIMGMVLITSLIITTIRSNLVLSLGMVGALSIIRLRTPVKDPFDIIYIFWAVAVGITTGAGLYIVALLGSIFIAVTFFIFIKLFSRSKNYRVIFQYEISAENDLMEAVKNTGIRFMSKKISKDMIEWSGTITTSKESDINNINKLGQMPGMIKTEITVK